MVRNRAIVWLSVLSILGLLLMLDVVPTEGGGVTEEQWKLL